MMRRHMDQSNVRSRIDNILCEILEISKDEITAESTIIGDLGATSVDVVDMLASLEEEFDIEISDSDAKSLRNVTAVVDFVSNKINAEPCH